MNQARVVSASVFHECQVIGDELTSTKYTTVFEESLGDDDHADNCLQARSGAQRMPDKTEEEEEEERSERRAASESNIDSRRSCTPNSPAQGEDDVMMMCLGGSSPPRLPEIARSINTTVEPLHYTKATKATKATPIDALI